MRRHPGRCSSADYARLFRMVVDQPGTTLELAMRFGMRADSLRRVLNTMRDMGLIFEVSLRGAQPVWSIQGPPLPRRSRQGSAARKVDTAVIFCRVATTLMNGASSREEIVEWGEVTRQVLRPVLNAMVSQRLVFVEDWRRRIPDGGPPVPLWRFGIDTTSKRKPPSMPIAERRRRKKETNERRNYAADLLFLTAGRVRPVPTTSHERTL